MKREDWLKDKLKNRFNDFDPQLDLDQAWNDLERRRNPKEDKRRVLYWVFGLGVVLIAISLYWNFNRMSMEEKQVANQEMEIEENHQIENRDPKLNREKEIKKISNSKEIAPHRIEYNTKRGTDERITLEAKHTNSTIASLSPSKLNVNIQTENFSTLSPKLQYASDATLAGTQKVLEQKEKRAQITKSYLIAKRPLTRIKTTRNRLLPKIVELTQPVKEGASYDLGLSLGYGIHARSLKDRSGEQSEFISSRNAQESALDALAINIFMRRNIFQNQFIELGAGFMQTSFLFQDQSIRNEQTELDNTLTERHTYPDGTEVLIYGAGIETMTITRDSRFYQNYRQLDLHAAFGHKIQLRNSLGLILSGGMEYSIFNSATGVAYSEESNQEYGRLGELGYRTGGLFSGLFNIGLTKELGAGYRTELGLAMKRNVSDLSSIERFSDKRNHLLAKVSFIKVLN